MKVGSENVWMSANVVMMLVTMVGLLEVCDVVVAFCPNNNNSGRSLLLRKDQSYDNSNVVGPLYMAASKSKKKKKKGNKSVAGLKGFGSASSSGALPDNVKLDKSKETMAFYEYLERNGAGGPQLKRVALAYFDDSLRGMVALKNIDKGDTILDIPYELAWNLGMESSDPTLPGITVLQDYLKQTGASTDVKNDDNNNNQGNKRADYLTMMPKFMSEDCLGSTDFFSETALEALQSPLIVEETKYRQQLSELRFERDIKPLLSNELFLWKETNQPVTEQHLRWAVWLVTSRVLTVQGDIPTQKYRLMIPLIDMCNHDRQSPHVLTGRAVAGGRLKVTAGCNIQLGQQINICYGGGVVGNDRFVQDYAFLDADEKAYDIVAKILTGRQRILEGKNIDRPTLLAVSDRQLAMESLQQTTIEQDQTLLKEDDNNTLMSNDMKSAIQYRLGVKLALQKLGDF